MCVENTKGARSNARPFLLYFRTMKPEVLAAGLGLIVVLGVAGFFYRNALEHPALSGACATEAKVCPDGTSVARAGPDCAFLPCPPPNVELTDLGIAYAVPAGFSPIPAPDEDTVASYGTATSSGEGNDLIVRRYPLSAGSDALSVIRANAIGDASGAPISPAAFTSASLGSFRFTEAPLGRFEGVVHTAYYLSRGADVLRFDAVDRGVLDWTDPALDVSTLPAHTALKQLLATLQVPSS